MNVTSYDLVVGIRIEIENVAVDLNVGFHVSNNVKALVQKQQTKYHFPDRNINRFIINDKKF